MAIASNLGFPRIGPKRGLKKALEAYWSREIEEPSLMQAGREIRRANLLFQKGAGIDHVPCNEFSFYDHVLDTAVMAGAIPSRYKWTGGPVDMRTYFAMARGLQDSAAGIDVPAMEMTKWFDTNYHYIVPELAPDQKFSLSSNKPVEEFAEARGLGVHARPVLVGPVSFLLLGKSTESGASTLDLLDGLLPVYEEMLRRLAGAGADWIQMDEPFLAMDIDDAARAAFVKSYARLAAVSPGLRLLVATYFEGLRENMEAALALPVAALHLDLVRAPEQLAPALAAAPQSLTLSLGVVDGRNVWRTDLNRALEMVEAAIGTLGSDRVMVGPSCSLMHVPVDLSLETEMEKDLLSWLAFAKQKIRDISLICRALREGRHAVQDHLDENRQAMEQRKASGRIHSDVVKAASAAVTHDMLSRKSPYAERRKAQRRAMRLPAFPTTTIGSFPQTSEVRAARADYKAGRRTLGSYEKFLRGEVEMTLRFQEEIGLDVLVHGESERNDMVEYFGEQLDGFAITEFGWVQSYGSRLVKPPIIYGDVERPEAMTVEWARFAQSLTERPVKGMLTGPVTILEWSFARDDQPRTETCKQIALAIREEAADLEESGIKVIQIDEPAFREGLPLRKADHAAYLEWAVDCFKLASSGVRDETQIQTHMCYSEFNDFLENVAAMDADVILIEAARSGMQLLDAFRRFQYPNEVGPGVYDIHSPRVPGEEEMQDLLRKALEVIPAERLWVNPDCGLKTRRWEEVKPSLQRMVSAARKLRGTAVATI
ncbi:MAG TPA: 5-methyltetrahydropteroyltriglutamate--homocysteine S-methyltransferase [Candidatus Saccharimonadales bacterium]|nr:5-methyltetrahydropteroyltriglutamate--homocysteine S-methyltransferase [Candidatus Saccharimonadales bacterium]